MVASDPEEGEVLLEDRIHLRTAPALGAVFDPIQHKAETARQLAYGLLVIFAGSVLASVIMAFSKSLTEGVDLATAVLPFTGTPLAVALGFYFGVSK